MEEAILRYSEADVGEGSVLASSERCVDRVVRGDTSVAGIPSEAPSSLSVVSHCLSVIKG